MTTIKYEKKGDIYDCSLILEDKTEIKIPLREDGYIFATGLCKAAGKDLSNWKRMAETKSVIKKIEEKVIREKALHKIELKDKVEKSNTRIPASQIVKKELQQKVITPAGNSEITYKELIEVYKGNSGKYKQGTWIHPDLGIHLAQWCNPLFFLQVSKWVREIIFTGEVKLGEEKKEEEISESYKKIIEDLEQKLKEKEEKLTLTEEEMKLQIEENKEISAKFYKLNLDHQSYLQRRQLFKIKQGSCIYLCDTSGLKFDSKPEIKVGNTGDINNRMASARTYAPFTKLKMVLYTDNAIEFEKAIKLKYKSFLLLQNHEFIIPEISYEEIQDGILKLAEILDIKYTLETEEDLERFNENKETREIVEETNLPVGTKRCGGKYHEKEEDRILTLDNFFKNSGNKDGVNRLCKRCYEISSFGDVRKKRKQVVIPQYNTESHKWCNICETPKERINFYKSKDTKDGLHPNCKECKTNQKRLQRERKKQENDLKTRYINIA
jgi:hypothetical protein